MNLKDEEWEPSPTSPPLLRQVRDWTSSCAKSHDAATLRQSLCAPPFNGAIPHELRGSVWLVLLRLRGESILSEEAASFAASARAAVVESSREQIEKDVARTRPSLARFKAPPVRGALLRLLSLFCLRSGVAYVQGLNEVLAPFVLLADTGGNPRLVYALFAQFVTRFAPWAGDFELLKRLFRYFGRLLLYHDPELYWMLERTGMTPDLYATSWLVTLFARNFTVEAVLALWDLLLLDDDPLGSVFFGIALLRDRRDDLLAVDDSRVPETLMLLTATPDHVRCLWKRALEMREAFTPPSFLQLMADRVLRRGSTALGAARAMQDSVCLQTTPADLAAGDAHYFTWDCRTEGEFRAGHLAQAAHLPLDAVRAAGGRLSEETSAAREELQRAVDLCAPLRDSSHICLVGSGIREEDNLDINMLALYLTRLGVRYVSTLRGGFREALTAAKDGGVELVDFDSKKLERARRLRARRATRNSGGGDDDGAPPPEQAERPDAAGLAAFLEKTDSEVSRALGKALSGIGFKYSLSSVSSALSGDVAEVTAPAPVKLSPSSVQDGKANMPNAKSDGRMRRSTSSIEVRPWIPTSRNGAASVDNSPRLLEVPSAAMTPRPGLHDAHVPKESPIRRRKSGLFGAQRSPWGRDARPGWLSNETLSFPLDSMPKGFTVNVMDDRVMTGLRLFPCKARSERSRRPDEFKKRYVGVCANYLLLLSPHQSRTHLLEVKLIRYLQDVSRITFKRSRPEVVTFEIIVEDDSPAETLVCLMPDGLKECVALIKKYLAAHGVTDETEGNEGNSDKVGESTPTVSPAASYDGKYEGDDASRSIAALDRSREGRKGGVLGGTSDRDSPTGDNNQKNEPGEAESQQLQHDNNEADYMEFGEFQAAPLERQ